MTKRDLYLHGVDREKWELLLNIMPRNMTQAEIFNCMVDMSLANTPTEVIKYARRYSARKKK